MSTPDTSAAFFEAMYRADDDPWDFAKDAYEQARYDTIVRALGTGRYRHAFEPGCSVGALTEKLARLCDRVDACDFSPTAVEQARQRCIAFSNVTVRCASLADPAPFGEYDLILLSEIGYYFPFAAWKSRVSDIVEAMQPGAVLLASHWLGSSPDHILSGDEVHAGMQHPLLEHTHGERHTSALEGGFRLDRWRKLP